MATSQRFATRPLAHLWLPLLLMMTIAVHAQPAGKCGEPAPNERLRNFVVVDANTGGILEGSTRFLEGDRVEVIVRNKNPYKYAYRFDVTANPLQPAIASDFLTPLGPIFRDKLPRFQQTARFTIDELITSFKGGGSPCSADDMKGQEERIAGIQESIDAFRREYEGQKDQLDNGVSQYDAFLLSTDNDRINCDAALDQATKLLPLLDGMIHLTDARSRLDRLRASLREVDTRFGELGRIIEGAPAECRAHVQEERESQMSGLRAYVDAIDRYIGDLAARRQQFEDLTRVIYAAGSGGSFTELLYPYTEGRPSAVQVEIFRRNLRSRDEGEKRVGAVQLQIGEARSISVSAGFGFSSLREVSYVRQSGKVADTLGTVFGYKYNSRFIPSTLLALNFHAAHWSWFGEKDMSAGLSIGYVLGSNFLEGDGQYMLGLTIGAINDNLLLTFAGHAARISELAGGFRIGDPIPASLPDPLPVQRDYKLGFMFAVTGRIR